MKKITFILSMSIICLFTYGQDNRLIYQDPAYDNPEKRVEILNRGDFNVSVDFVKIDLEKIFIYEQFTLQFGEYEMTVNKKSVISERWDKFSFHGRNDNDYSDVFLVVTKNNRLSGSITTPKREQYQIETIDENNYAIIKKDYTKFKEECDNLHDGMGELPTGIESTASNGASLQQNSPNPFNQSTVIRYTLPQTGKPAQLVISNTAGAIVRQIPLQSGTDSVTIESDALSAGIYYYSLYVGNSLIDTKKMILTK